MYDELTIGSLIDADILNDKPTSLGNVAKFKVEQRTWGLIENNAVKIGYSSQHNCHVGVKLIFKDQLKATTRCFDTSEGYPYSPSDSGNKLLTDDITNLTMKSTVAKRFYNVKTAPLEIICSSLMANKIAFLQRFIDGDNYLLSPNTLKVLYRPRFWKGINAEEEGYLVMTIFSVSQQLHGFLGKNIDDFKQHNQFITFAEMTDIVNSGKLKLATSPSLLQSMTGSLTWDRQTHIALSNFRIYVYINLEYMCINLEYMCV